MRLSLFVIGVVCVDVCLANAQATPGTATEALHTADATAAEILRPIAEDMQHPDPWAQFVMASAYEDGRGVAADPIRACTLYTRVWNPGKPYAEPHQGVTDEDFAVRRLQEAAQEKVSHFQAVLSTEEFRECQFLYGIGFDHRFEPVTLWLEPDLGVHLTLRSATVTAGGKDTPVEWELGGLARAGIVFLPIAQVDVTAGNPPIRRHFLEISEWSPQPPEWNTWQLTWHLYEVVRDDVVQITVEPLLTVASDPSKEAPVDVHGLARVRVTDEDDLEWVVGSGRTMRHDVIVPDAERREALQQRAARRSAEERVDWARFGDIRRSPSFTYRDADGCGRLLAYGWSDDRMEAVSIRVDQDALQLSSMPQTFDLATNPRTLELVVHVYDRPLHSWPFCTDLIAVDLREEGWKAMGGQVTIQLLPPLHAAEAYRSRVIIDIVDAEFLSPNGVHVRQTLPIRLTATVGGVFG